MTASERGERPSCLDVDAKPDLAGPRVVFVNGATRERRHHPKVQRLTRGLARAGFLVVVPDLPGLALGKITPATVAGTIDVAEATSGRPDVREGRVGFYGVSVGASLALLAAASPPLGGRVTVGGGKLVALLENRDPGRFEGLYLRLPAHVRKAVAALSPIRHAAGSTCPSSSRRRRTTSTSRPPSHAGSRPSRQTCA